jgi:hypothetical protein
MCRFQLVTGLAEVLLGLACGEDVEVELVLDRVVGQVLDDHRGLLLVDQAHGFGDEALGVGLELCEDRDVDALEDVCRRASGQLRAFGQLADQVVLDCRMHRLRLFRFCGLELEAIATLQRVIAVT